MIRVRPAAVDDVPHLIEIARHSATAGSWNESEYEKLFTQPASAGAGGAAVLVIEENGQIAGFLAGRRLTPDGAEWEIENVAVSGPARRRGLGSRLLGEFLALAREQCGREIFLEVRASNVAARRLYEKWAFAEAGVRKSYYQGPTEDALVLRLSFPQNTSKTG
jgi:[ribosomal protein S18]-alanine N-acetyltransferase